MIAMTLARTLMTAVKFGIFEAVSSGCRSAEEVARATFTHPGATGKLLRALRGSGYLVWNGDGYELSAVSAKWLLGEQRNLVLHRFVDAMVLDRYDTFLRTGEAAAIFDHLTHEQWRLYEAGQRIQAGLIVGEVVRRTPVPRGAMTLLDIGGGHAAYSGEFCRRFPKLRSTVLDLAPAVAQGAELVKHDPAQTRVGFRTGNAQTDDLGRESFDVILLSNLAHHFTYEVNRQLMLRMAQALRPGGTCVIVDAIRPDLPGESRQIESLLDFYFACSSGGGTWTEQDLANWQRGAGLLPLRLKRLVSLPGWGLQIARKPVGPI
jgi:SAM-dependent methyltransferase